MKNIKKNIALLFLFAAFAACFIAAVCGFIPADAAFAEESGMQVSKLSDDGIVSEGYLSEYSYGTEDSGGVYISSYETNAGNYGSNVLARAFDGDWSTFWEAGTQNSDRFTAVVTVTFSGTATVDRIIYAMRQDGYSGRGFPTTFSVYVSATEDGDDFGFVGSASVSASTSKMIYTLDEACECRRIRLEFTQIYSADIMLASASELIFLKPEEDCVKQIRGIFTDYNCLTLTSEYTKTEIENIINSVRETAAYAASKEVAVLADRAQQILKGNSEYESEREFSTDEQGANVIARRGDIAGYARNTLKMVWMGTNRQATGIGAAPGDELVIYVDCEEGDPLPSIVFTQQLGNWNKWMSGQYTLARGINIISVPNLYSSEWSVATNPGGPVYLVNPYGETEQSANVRIYIEGGYTFPLYRAGEDEETFRDELTAYYEEYSAGSTYLTDLTEIVSDNAIFTVTATTAVKYIIESDISPEQICEDWETYLKALYAFAGVSLDESDPYYDARANYLNVNIRVMQPYAAAYAYTEHVGIQKGGSWEYAIFTGNGYYGWGITHELGHMMDISERTWSEYTNNMWSQFDRCYIEGDAARGNFDNFLAATVADGTDYSERLAYTKYTSDALSWWVIESRYPGFWGRFENNYRYSDRKNITSAAELHVYFASLAAGADLSYYFARIGFQWNGVSFQGYDYASEAFRAAIDQALADGLIIQNELKLWYEDAQGYNYTVKYGDSLALYDGTEQIDFTVSRSSSGITLVMPQNSNFRHLGYEILRGNDKDGYYVIGFTYGSTYTDTSPLGDGVYYKIRAYDRLLGCSALSSSKSAASGAVAQVNGQQYATLAEAFAAAQDGDTVYLLADAAESGIAVTKNITLQPSGADVTVYLATASAMFNVKSGATLTVCGADGYTITLDGNNLSKSEALIVSGGTLNINGGAVIQNCYSTSGGGAVRLTGGTLNIGEDAVFRYNTGVNGGAIFCQTASVKININGALFYGNSATSGGGAVYATCTINISGAQFCDNSAVSGGAVNISGGGVLTLSGCIFGGNVASSMGGALYLDGKTTFDAQTTAFSSNSSAKGGAVYVASSSSQRRAVISNAEFYFNCADEGSEIYIAGYSGLGAAGTALSIEGGYAEGGALYIAQGADVTDVAGSFVFSGSIYCEKALSFGTSFDAAESSLNITFTYRGFSFGSTVAEFASAISQETDLSVQVLFEGKYYKAELNGDGTAVTLTEERVYALTFGGGALGALYGVFGDKITLPEPTEQSGKRFVGWIINGNVYSAGDSFLIEGDADAEAKWVNVYTISFEGSDTLITADEGTEITLPEPTEQSGKRFAGWIINGKIYYAGEVITLSENIKAEATWVNVYTVSFEGSDTVITAEEGEIIILPDMGESKTDFLGWKFGGVVYPAGEFKLTDEVVAAAQDGAIVFTAVYASEESGIEPWVYGVVAAVFVLAASAVLATAAYIGRKKRGKAK